MLVYKFKQRHYKSCSYSHGLQPYFIHVFVLCFSHGLQPLYFIHVFVLCFWFSHGLQSLYFIHVFVFWSYKDFWNIAGLYLSEKWQESHALPFEPVLKNSIWMIPRSSFISIKHSHGHRGKFKRNSFVFLYFAFDFHMGYNLYISFMFLYFAFDFHMGYNLYISFMFLYFALIRL
jgi:hypothetical protein